MSYYFEILLDKMSHSKELVFDEVVERVFFQNYYCTTKGEYHQVPLKNIIEKIGNKADIQTIIDACKRWTKDNNQEMAIVACHMRGDEIVKDAGIQKLLDFSIHHTVSGNIILNGGVLFHHGKVSFHT